MENEEGKQKNRNSDNWKKEFSERLLTFAAEIIKLTSKLNSSYSSQHITKQIIRSATSMGANYEEACNAESRNDFLHKLQIVLKESQETLYWLRLIAKADLLVKTDDCIHRILDEAMQINRIIAKSVLTAKQAS
jgi:four helix bundle protein